jgi:hypothetical protein
MDTILLNLKILGKIEKNGRVSRSQDGIISIEEESHMLFIKRMYNGNNRQKSLKEINNIVNSATEKISDLLNSKYLYNEGFNVEKTLCLQKVKLLYNELSNSTVGITNLKTTYQRDPQIISEIDLLLNKIEDIVLNTENELSKFVDVKSKEKNI